MSLAPTAPPPPQGRPPDERTGPDFTEGRELLEIGGLLLALGGSAWLFSELAARLGDRVRARLGK